MHIFRRFLLADVLNWFAMMVGQVAIPWWITVQNGIHDLAIYAIASASVACVAIPILSTIGDRYNKRFLIQVGLGIYMLSAIAMALFAAMGHYDIRVIAMLEAVAITGVALVSPLASVIAADILPTALLSNGMQKQKLWQSVGQLGGPIIGGAALAYDGVTFALSVQVLLIALAIVLVRRLPKVASSTSANAKQPLPRRSWLTELTAGARAKWRIALERNWTIISFLVGISLVPSIGMLLPLKVHAMNLSGQWLGICEAAVSLGLLMGAGIGTSTFLVSLIGRYRLRFLAMMLLGPALMMVGYSPTPVLMAGALMLVGLMNSIVVMMGYSRRILATPHRFRTRMSAVNIMLTQLAAIIGPAVAGVGLLHWSITSTYLIFGVALLICSFGYLLTPDFRTFMSLGDHEVDEWYGQRYPEAFE
jgi:MFS family permease